MFEQYCLLCEQIKLISQYIEWIETGGATLYGSKETAERWYRSLLEISGELLAAAIS